MQYFVRGCSMTR